MFFVNKNNEVYFDNCLYCKKVIKQFELFALRKYGKIDEEKNEKILEDEKLFCSNDCLKKYLEETKLKNYDLFKLNRCSSYYDCLQIYNIRKMCEQQEQLNVEKSPLTLLACNFPKNFCEPANAGLVKSSVKLFRLIEQAEKSNNFKFWLTTILTVLVVFLTILNIYLTFK